MNFPTCIQTSEIKNNSDEFNQNSNFIQKNNTSIYESPKKTKINSFNYYNEAYNSNDKNSFNTIPKPDFSPFNSNQLSVKPYGSYKKQKIIYPESPAKIPGLKYFTPSNTKLISKQLFSTNQTSENNNKNLFFIRKLNFDETDNIKKNLFHNDENNQNNNNPFLNFKYSNFQLTPFENKKSNNYELLSLINN